MAGLSQQAVVAEIEAQVAAIGPDALLPYTYLAIVVLQDGRPAADAPWASYVAGVHAVLSSPKGANFVRSSLTTGGKIHGAASIFSDVFNGVRPKPTRIGLMTLKNSYSAPAIKSTFGMNSHFAREMRKEIAAFGGIETSDLLKLEKITERNSEVDRRTAEVDRRTSEVDRRAAELDRQIAITDMILGVIKGPYDENLRGLIRRNIELVSDDRALYSLLKDVLDGKTTKLRSDQIVLFEKYTK